jgi:hypothetical protein
VATSPRITDTVLDIEERWTLSRLLEAHMALDVHDEMEWKASKPK